LNLSEEDAPTRDSSPASLHRPRPNPRPIKVHRASRYGRFQEGELGASSSIDGKGVETETGDGGICCIDWRSAANPL